MTEADAERGRLRRAAAAARERIRAARQAHEGSGDESAEDDFAMDESTRNADAAVPYALRLCAAWTWRFLVLAAGGYVLVLLIGQLSQVLIPLAIALLLSALLAPAVGFLRTRGRMPASLATALVLVGGLVVVLGTLTLVITQFVDGVPALAEKAATGVREIQRWLRDGPLDLSSKQLDDGQLESMTTALRLGPTWST